MVYIDPRTAAKVRARKAAVHAEQVRIRDEANRQAMAYVAGLRKVSK